MEKTQTFTVSDGQSAINLGSGTLPVFGTPALVACMENTAWKAVENLQEGETTVGISMDIQHLKASAIGETITCTARITAVEGRKISFDIEARNERGELIGKATHDRFVVNAEKFMAKLR